MKLGIVGLPNVGKSAFFNSLTKAGAATENYPFCTIDPNIGVVPVPDNRLKKLAKIHNTTRIIPTTIEFVDIAGLVRGASKGEGLGNKFLSHIREIDAIVHVVRCFEDEDIIHVDNSVDPIRDIETINYELIFSDIETLDKRMEKASRAVKADKSFQTEIDLINKLKKGLLDGVSVRNIDLNDEEKEIVKTFNILTDKPMLYAANISEDVLADDSDPYSQKVIEYAANENSEAFRICIKIEEEISALDDEERQLFLEELGVNKSGLEQIIAAGYKILGLISFITSGEIETRAWTVPKGAKAPEAASKIHTDIQKGFIKAEVMNYDDLIRLGSNAAVKNAGLLRIEGRDYVVKDGDVILFKFNV